jgi:hypothetical protein
MKTLAVGRAQAKANYGHELAKGGQRAPRPVRAGALVLRMADTDLGAGGLVLEY